MKNSASKIRASVNKLGRFKTDDMIAIKNATSTTQIMNEMMIIEAHFTDIV